MDWMRLALQLAEQGRQTCPPNPMVGCVIVKDGVLVGQGCHRVTGGPHAEVFALAMAGKEAAGSDVYVTLEPCAHYGRTAPCVDALISSQVSSVHIAILDPNPLVRGQGVQKLQRAGIDVQVGQYQEEAYQLNLPFFHYITRSMPYVVAKWAMTLDGKIATSDGKSKWITSEAARLHAHRLRAEMSAIMVGASTLRHDNPQLTVRLPREGGNEHGKDVRQPRPIVISASGNIPLSSAIFDGHRSPLVISSTAISAANLKALEERQIATRLFPLRDGRLSIQEILVYLASQAISPILVEGGSHLLTSLFQADCVNQIYAYIAPKIMGGDGSLTPIAGENPFHMDQLKLLHGREVISLGPDICLAFKTAQTSHSYAEFLNQKEL